MSNKFVLDKMAAGQHHFQRVSIATVERETGLSKDTLRMWERRYGFPRPARDDNGEREEWPLLTMSWVSHKFTLF